MLRFVVSVCVVHCCCGGFERFVADLSIIVEREKVGTKETYGSIGVVHTQHIVLVPQRQGRTKERTLFYFLTFRVIQTR